MLDQLRQIAIFAKTIECGSFAKAASALQLSPSVVSHHVSQLEKRLGVALIYRSTRQLSLTSDGEKLLKYAQEMTHSAEEFINLAANNDYQLMGHLNVTLPAFMAKSDLIKHIGDFIKLNPNISIKMDFSDNQRKIIEDGIDLAIRMGNLKDSNLKARKLCDMDRLLVVSKNLLKNLPPHKSPRDLENEQWIEFSPVGLKYVFKNASGKEIKIHPRSKIATNSIYATLQLIRNSNGIGVLPKFIVDKEKQEANLIHTLKSWQLLPISVYAIWPSNTPANGLTKKLIEFLLSKNVYF
ncbi:MAG: LysR family transcriptional regulator [Arenicella sp.]